VRGKTHRAKRHGTGGFAYGNIVFSFAEHGIFCTEPNILYYHGL